MPLRWKTQHLKTHHFTHTQNGTKNKMEKVQEPRTQHTKEKLDSLWILWMCMERGMNATNTHLDNWKLQNWNGEKKLEHSNHQKQEINDPTDRLISV